VNYYNEIDPKAAQWLRELIAAGLIPPGNVDERSITDVRPADLRGYTQCHFFAGIGGWSYALKLAGWPTDHPVWTGSCPCQPFSAAGKRMGKKDSRHLWPAFRRLINQCAPPVVFGEQVASKDGRQWLAGVFANLETMGYAAAGSDLCAASIGAPHIRQRLYWLAIAQGQLLNGAAESRQHLGEIRSAGANESVSAGRGRSVGGMADTDGGGSGAEREQPGREHGQQSKDGSAVRVEYSESNGREQWRTESSGWCVASGCGTGGMGNANEQGCAGGALGLVGSASAWGQCETILCADGKARRIESGLQPLAHGVSGRVGLLRGYGNAIVPQVAAEFIKSVMEL
jgi:DNA (cytosine-5)-methyltransferase 1